MSDLEELHKGLKRVIALHRSGHVTGLPGGMPGCEHCSHGPDIGDEGGSGGVMWPCPTLCALAGITERAQSKAEEQFKEWERVTIGPRPPQRENSGTEPLGMIR